MSTNDLINNNTASTTKGKGNQPAEKKKRKRKRKQDQIKLEDADCVGFHGFHCIKTSQLKMYILAVEFGGTAVAHWPMDHSTKNHKGYFFVKYEDRKSAQK